MEITLDKLVSLVSESYDRGIHGCADLRRQEIDELLRKYGVKEKDDFKIWSVEELKKMPEGSIFNHITRGRGYIAIRSNGSKYMQFEKCAIVDLLADQDPWDKPMQLIHTKNRK